MSENKRPFNERPIAITDIETTGTDPRVHEIIEIGLVLVDQPTLNVISTYEVKIKPEHLELAQPRALEVNGYKEADWRGALTLKAALESYAALTHEAAFLAHSVTFDWPFMEEGFRKTGVTQTMDRHRLCNMTLAWGLLRQKGLVHVNQKEVAQFLGIEPEPDVHRAINGAMLAYRILRKLSGL